MRYAKLDGGLLILARNPLPDGDVWRGNPTAEIYRQYGWKPLRSEERPQQTPEPGWILVPVWTETENEIVQSWSLRELPQNEELGAEAALEILLGGEAG